MLSQALVNNLKRSWSNKFQRRFLNIFNWKLHPSENNFYKYRQISEPRGDLPGSGISAEKDEGVDDSPGKFGDLKPEDIKGLSEDAQIELALKKSVKDFSKSPYFKTDNLNGNGSKLWPNGNTTDEEMVKTSSCFR